MREQQQKYELKKKVIKILRQNYEFKSTKGHQIILGSIRKYYCGAANSYSSLDTLPSRRRNQCASPSLLSELPNHFQPKMKTTKITHLRGRGNVKNGNSFEFCSFRWFTGFAEFKLEVHNESAHAEYQNSVYLVFFCRYSSTAAFVYSSIAQSTAT